MEDLKIDEEELTPEFKAVWEAYRVLTDVIYSPQTRTFRKDVARASLFCLNVTLNAQGLITPIAGSC